MTSPDPCQGADKTRVPQPQAAPAFDYLTPQYQTPPIELPSNRRQIYETPSYQPPSYSPPSSRTTYDWQSGNTYTTRKRYNGDTDVTGRSEYWVYLEHNHQAGTVR